MKPKYEWYPMVVTATFYPVQLISGAFICDGENDVRISDVFPVANTLWGDDGGVMIIGDKKPVPNGIYIKWLSALEGQLYEGTFDLPHEQMSELFKSGFVEDLYTGKPKPGYPYDYIKVGLAPGGVVAVWLSGFNSQILLGQFTADKVPAEDSLFEAWSNTQAEQSILLKDDSNEQVLNMPIPYGLWDEYNRRFSWRYNIRLEDEKSSFNTINSTYSNGEQYFIYTPEMMSEYNSRAYPRDITIMWDKDSDTYVANIRLNKPMILDAFQQMSQKTGDNVHIDFCVDISRYNNLLKFSLESGEHKIELPEEATKIMIFIPVRDNKVVYCSHNWDDETNGVGLDYFNEYYVIKK
ncbi:DUF2931 family protein [Culturomica massiliensis]|uniref:DUF2931 family protein n=1 Tax=Culturomica massiliensis TaxID=1841857 RepID=UPI003AB4875B